MFDFIAALWYFMATKPRKKLIILVIEDYKESREMLRLLLETQDYQVLTAANGEEGVALATNNRVDLVLTDLGLPNMDGLSVVRRLRSLNARLRRTPIIMLTAFDGDEYYYSALRAGCTDFLTKPPDFEALQAMIERLLPRSGDRENTSESLQFRES